MVTSNQSLGAWGGVFGDSVTAATIAVDRFQAVKNVSGPQSYAARRDCAGSTRRAKVV